MTMTFRNWIDLLEVQEIINQKPSDVKMLFSPRKIVSTTTNAITVEWGKTGYALTAVSHALAWSCSQETLDFKAILIDLSRQLTTHLAVIETANEAFVLQIQAQIL